MQNSLYILGQLSDQDVEWLLAGGVKQHLAAGAVLIRQGQPVDALYIVLDGTLSVLIGPRDDTEINRVGPGEILGEMSYVDARPPSATVRAVEPAVVFAVNRQQLSVRLEHDAPFAARFYRALAIFLSDRLRHTMGLLHHSATAADDELDPNVLDTVHLAGARLRHILQRLQGG